MQDTTAALAGNDYRDLRVSIRKDLDDRINAHRGKIAKVRSMAKALRAGQTQALNLIAQGDSWFDYPLPVPKINQSDVIAHLQHLPALSPEILSLAHYGEAAEDMLGVSKLHDLIAQLKDPDNGSFDAILFSGGGNDLAGDQFRLWIVQAAAGASAANSLNPGRVKSILGVVAAGYEDLFAARNQIDPTIPVFGHSYDFAIPNGVGVACVGPWLKPSLDDRGWTDAPTARAIVKQLLLAFAALLDGFAANAANNFIHVKTQGTLADNEWANELHPTADGFAAISAKFVDALRARFPGRI